jgi:hypothetical protein
MTQGSFEGRFNALREDHGEASLTGCTTFVNHGVVFVQTLDSHGRGSYGRGRLRLEPGLPVMLAAEAGRAFGLRIG